VTTLRRHLGLTAVIAVVMGDILGSGIFFTPGELATVAHHPWQVYFIWTLCGLIVLCGALTLGELVSILPRAGASYHIMGEAFGPFWGFVRAWMEIFVSAPGSIASIAIVFGEFVTLFLDGRGPGPPVWGIVAIAVFAAINLMGVSWGGRTQIALTGVKIAGLLAIVLGSLMLADPAPREVGAEVVTDIGISAFLRFLGLGVAAVLFTYDGWLDVSHVAGEVSNPKRNLPFGLGFGVFGILCLYVLVNYAFLRVVPLSIMREAGTTIAATVATATFGTVGGQVVNAVIMTSIFGALGGLVMTAPRIVYAPSESYVPLVEGRRGGGLIRALAYVSPTTGVPSSAILFSAVLASVAILFFGTFGRLVSFILVPLQFANIVLVASVFRLRKRTENDASYYRTPGYPWVPLVFIAVMSLLLVSAIVYNPLDTLIGVGLMVAGAPVYWWIHRGTPTESAPR
jgi:APA family basic amino acid/polyamine antiporter